MSNRPYNCIEGWVAGVGGGNYPYMYVLVGGRQCLWVHLVEPLNHLDGNVLPLPHEDVHRRVVSPIFNDEMRVTASGWSAR